jgi:hypothetical protein
MRPLFPVLIIAILSASPGLAQRMYCVSRERVMAVISDQLAQSRRAMGLSANGAVMELYANDETREWTLTVTLPDGQTCLLANGAAFEAGQSVLPAVGSRL